MIYNLIVFDLDGTLSLSKCPMDEEMSTLLKKLLEKKFVAVISGGTYNQYKKQFLATLNCDDKILLKKLFLFPTCSTAFYKFENEWEQIYNHDMKLEERQKIISALQKMCDEINYHPEVTYGDLIEDRISQVTFSALGQQAPVELKSKWDPDCSKRIAMKKILEKYITEFDINFGGGTSLDITQKGIDKAYGMQQIMVNLGFKKEEILFIGDKLQKGGNDFPVIQTGVKCIEVSSPEDTKKEILKLI